MVGRAAVVVLGLCALTTACSLDDRKVAFVGTGGRGAQAGGDAGGAGGETAGGASGGEAGAGRTALCTGTLPERALITDFSDAVEIAEDDERNPGISFDFGPSPGGAQSFVFDGPGLEAPHISLAGAGNADEQAMRVVATPGTPLGSRQGVGFGLGWFGCVDATEYTGIAFTIRGTLGTCDLYTGVNFGENTRANLNPFGSCELGANCYPPISGPVTDEGIHEARFEDMTGGNPMATVDAARILGLNWQLGVPADGSCTADFTVDDVRFFR